MHLLKEKIMLEYPNNPAHQFAEPLGGYSYCFNIEPTDDIESVLQIVLAELYDDLYEIIERDGIFAVGWMCKRYNGTGTYQ